ncbi:Pleiotropic drug resistance protein 3 [Morella rubra]|uniref:Pleiotropic drug resistance protein 3 n=1 Tax=Morella rubra TaxID=262757 RepID=A0A6A1UQH6_9ROSI|nr:Pleiotropic drug resistance protein 3 [Morella rubra]
MTVREILDFSARCQGVGSRSDYVYAVSASQILGLDICADTLVGDAMRRGISGGQKKRLTTGEMIVGPTKALFMDEITNGLDSSTAFQVVSCLQQLVHMTDATVLVSLLQPAPETFDLFDDLILMSEGKILYHGPRDHVLEYFEVCGFRCPERKGVADFVQEVISRKDQAQYWCRTEEPYAYVSVDMLSRKFKESSYGKKLAEELSEPYDKSQGHQNSLSLSAYSLSKWELLRACASRELLLMKRNSFIYIQNNSAPGSSRVIISHEKLSKILGSEDSYNGAHADEESGNSPPHSNSEPKEGRMVLPFTPLTIVFQDVQYYVDTPLEMRERGFTNKKLQLLSDITGALRPGVLTALMGVSGAGKTTLLDVLSGRKTSGYIEGQIKIGGYLKVQETFARISGYCEQTDIHSPQITVEESVIFSAWLRLSAEIDSKTKSEFVHEVLKTIELDEIKDALVGIPGVTGLSTEQRKRLTIAVELVANPSIIFMDEPTTGLDARAAAIVMRAVKNVVDTGRTIVCTVHQPSIHIFETFDEGIPGVPKIRDNYNPSTWMIEVTSPSAETELGVDFAQKYRESTLYENNKELVRQLSSPIPGSKDLHFPTRFSRNGLGQVKSCLWKQHLAYWRNPSYNLTRVLFATVSALICGALYWNHGKKLNNQQNLFNIFGSMYASVIFLGINNCSTVLPYVATERTVMYRERFAGMYSSWAYALAQQISKMVALVVLSGSYILVAEWFAYFTIWRYKYADRGIWRNPNSRCLHKRLLWLPP